MARGKGKRRGSGEGSISYRAKEERYEAKYVVHTSHGPKRKTLYAKTYEEARKKLARAVADRDEGLSFDADGLTFEGWLRRWLTGVRSEVRRSTYERYEQICRLHLIPVLGKTSLPKLKAAHLEGLYHEKLAEGLSPRSVKYVHATARRALGEAVRLEVLNRNPAINARPPGKAEGEVNSLIGQQAADLLRAAEAHRLHALFVLALHTGMRRSELLGLRWSDVDLEGGSLEVRRGLTAASGGAVVAATKRPSSRRKIDLSETALSALHAHRKCQREEELASPIWQPTNYVFAGRAGGHLSPHTVRTSFAALVRQVGLPEETRFHDLRHTFATLSLAAGTDIKTVSEMLGHSDTSTTLRIYAHVLPGQKKEAAKAIEAALST